jgi:hypothetical protein
MSVIYNKFQFGGKSKKSIDKMTKKEFDEFHKKMLQDIKIMFSDACCCVMWLLNESPLNAYYCGKQITKSKLDSVAIKKNFFKMSLIIPVSRDESAHVSLTIKKSGVTYRELFTLLYDYYNKHELSLKELYEIGNDGWDYVKDAIARVKKGKTQYLIDIMGDLCRFEDVRKIRENTYMLILGS